MKLSELGLTEGETFAGDVLSETVAHWCEVASGGHGDQEAQQIERQACGDE